MPHLSLSLRARLTLLLVGAVLLTVLLAGAVVSRAVLQPFSKQILQGYVHEAVYAAELVARGADPAELGEQLGVTIERARPLSVAERGDWRPEQYRHHELYWRRDRGQVEIRVKAKRSWFSVQRDIDLNNPTKRIRLALLLLGVGLVGVAAWAAQAATRPLDAARQAMSRIAGGDLDHRLPEEGPPELVQVARDFNGMTAQIRDMLRFEKELMAGISHELRTPLTRLRLEIEMLRGWDGGVPDRRIQAMEGDLEEIDRLIGEVLEISRLELGRQRLGEGRVALAALAQEAIERCPLPDHEVSLELIDEGAAVLGDAPRLLRVLTNLLSNAGKYAPPGTRVTLRVEGRRLAVLDEGPGVPADQLDQIFSPFHRVDRSRSRETGGLGLGLMICRQIVELHGGTILARNRAAGGLSVELDLSDAPAA